MELSSSLKRNSTHAEMCTPLDKKPRFLPLEQKFTISWKEEIELARGICLLRQFWLPLWRSRPLFYYGNYFHPFFGPICKIFFRDDALLFITLYWNTSRLAAGCFALVCVWYFFCLSQAIHDLLELLFHHASIVSSIEHFVLLSMGVTRYLGSPFNSIASKPWKLL